MGEQGRADRIDRGWRTVMKRVVLALLVVALMASTAPAQATRNSIGGQSAPPNPCHGKRIRDLGNPPCETMSEPTTVLCNLDRPYYETKYRFRWYNGTEWSQWWLYYRWLKRAPSGVCAGELS